MGALRGRIVTVVSRRPFDPSLARGGLFEGPRGGEPEPISVTEASAILRRAIEGTGEHRIVGEVSNFTQRQHWYFTVKDEESQLDCVMWASANGRSQVTPANGMEVVLTGRPTHYGPRGKTQLVVTRIERRGAGSLQQRFEELCRVLREQGYFDEARKQPLPAYPRAIAVVTSATGAALQDVLRTARIRAPFVRILVIDVPVQGDLAAPAVARAIDAVDRRADELSIDAIVVTRGGGSLEDLWAFNERAVADAVFRARTPIVAAIGHESDTTVIELVADRRASTPTAAIMALLPDREGMVQQVDHLHDRLEFLLRRRVHESRRELEALARHPMFRSPASMVAPHRLAVDRAAERMRAAVRARVAAARHRLSEARSRFEPLRPAIRQAAARERLRSLDARLRAAIRRSVLDLRGQVASADRQLRLLGPEETLGRGWSLTFDERGVLVRRTADARPGSVLVSKFADGTVRSRVEGKSAPEAKAVPDGTAASEPESDPESLFGPAGG
jgi:exodeoxyribonuclease VII large subunit